MINRKRLLLSATTISACLVLLLIIKYVSDNPLRKQIPEYPGFQNVPELLKKQIKTAGRKAYINPTSDNLGELGMVYYSSAYNDNANRCFQLAIKKNVNRWLWSYYLGYLNLEMGESKASIENFSNVIKAVPDNYLAQFYTAEAYQNLGLTGDAEKIFKKIASLSDRDIVKDDTIRENYYPLQTYARFHLARISMDAGQPDSAISILKDIIRTQNTFGPAYRLLGTVYTKAGDQSLGNKYITQANDMVEYTPPSDVLIDRIALMSRSDTYLLKQIDDALHGLNFKWELKLFDHSMKYVPESKFLISKALFGYLFLNYGNKALPYLDQHLRLYSDDFNEMMLFAILLYDKGYQEQAEKYFNQAKKIKPTDSKLVLYLAERGRADEAILLLNEQLKKEPENVIILTDAVRLFSGLNDKEKMTLYLTRIKKLTPSGPGINKLEGEVAENEGNLNVAISHYEAVMSEDPKNLFVIRHLVGLYTNLKMWDKLIIHFRRSLDKNPNEPYLLEGLGRMLITCPDTSLRNNEEGIEYCERAWLSFKSTPGIKMSSGKNLATAFAMKGDKKKASLYISLTTALAGKMNAARDLIPYFNDLRKQYGISE
jgi:tetratricopeptide (TPR) repeat protein